MSCRPGCTQIKLGAQRENWDKLPWNAVACAQVLDTHTQTCKAAHLCAVSSVAAGGARWSCIIRDAFSRQVKVPWGSRGGLPSGCVRGSQGGAGQRGPLRGGGGWGGVRGGLLHRKWSTVREQRSREGGQGVSALQAVPLPQGYSGWVAWKIQTCLCSEQQVLHTLAAFS